MKTAILKTLGIDSKVRHEFKQVGGFFSSVIARNCTKDEGRPLEADLQE